MTINLNVGPIDIPSRIQFTKGAEKINTFGVNRYREGGFGGPLTKNHTPARAHPESR
jgi:hypothetical protein